MHLLETSTILVAFAFLAQPCVAPPAIIGIAAAAGAAADAAAAAGAAGAAGGLGAVTGAAVAAGAGLAADGLAAELTTGLSAARAAKRHIPYSKYP
jgi:hypothetical protein